MRLDEIGGEHGFIARVRQTHAGAPGHDLLVSIGDDAAVIAAADGSDTVVTTDMLLETIHFRRDWSDPYSIGWKTAAVNISDIAAMGAMPTWSFLSLAVPRGETVEFLDRLYDGLMDCLNRYDATLAGGDTNASPDGLVLSLTQMGRAPSGKAFTRKGAEVGDILLVTGLLGDSAMGLALLTEYGLSGAEKVSKELVNAHRRPQPRVFAGRAAMDTGGVHAAIDLSDGLMGDLKKLCAASGVGARIDTADLPISSEMRRAADLLGKDPVTVALEGGEDYELLLAAAPEAVEDLTAAIELTGVRVTRIGQILKTNYRIVAPNGTDELLPSSAGFDHFSA